MSGLVSEIAQPGGLASLPPLPAGIRIYAIGDVHGRFDLLQELTSGIRRDLLDRPRPERTMEIFLGDYVDRGPQSREVVDWMISSSPLTDERICLLGNHEDILLGALDDTEAMANWLYNGGGETLLSYGVAIRGFGGKATLVELQKGFRAALPSPHFEFFASLPRKLAVAPFLFVHAGVRPGRSIDDQDPHDLIWIREPFLHSSEDFGYIVVHGHTPAMHPEVRSNRINIDTGAVFTGRLTCLVLERAAKRFLQTAPP